LLRRVRRSASSQSLYRLVLKNCFQTLSQIVHGH
jgi:hypothetical protein